MTTYIVASFVSKLVVCLSKFFYPIQSWPSNVLFSVLLSCWIYCIISLIRFHFCLAYRNITIMGLGCLFGECLSISCSLISFYTAAPLSLCCSVVPEAVSYASSQVSEFIVRGRAAMPDLQLDWWEYARPFLQLGWYQWAGATIFIWGWCHQLRCHAILVSFRFLLYSMPSDEGLSFWSLFLCAYHWIKQLLHISYDKCFSFSNERYNDNFPGFITWAQRSWRVCDPSWWLVWICFLCALPCWDSNSHTLLQLVLSSIYDF